MKKPNPDTGQPEVANTKDPSAQQVIEQAECLRHGLQALANARASSEIFDSVILTLNKQIPFSRAAILQLEQQYFSQISSTHPDFSLDGAPLAGVFERTLDGQPTVVMNAQVLPEWRALPNETARGFAAAVMVPLITNRFKGLLVCAHTDRCAFTEAHKDTLDFFAPFATQAFQRLQDIQALETLVDQLNASVEYKSQFLATVSHEIRTPINGVIGLADLLAETQLDDTQRNWVHLINASGKSLLYVINEVLDFSKLEAGKMETESISFSPDELVDDLLAVFSFRTEETNVPLYALIADDIPATLMGDPTRIKQILTNFLSNAFKFCDRGTILLTTERVPLPGANSTQPHLPFEPASQGIRFKVQDEGIGLNDSQKQTIFEAFCQADPSVSRKYGGTGLGLNICHRLATLLGGSIGVESELGEGSAFWFDSPLTAGEHHQPCHLPAQACEAWAIGVIANGDSLLHIGSVLKRLGCDFMPVDPSTPTGQLSAINLWVIDMETGSAEAQHAQALLKNLGNVPVILLNLHATQRHLYQHRAQCHLLPKPLRFSAMHDCMLQIAQHPDGATPPRTRPDTMTPLPRKLNVLVAEDNDVNQVVIRGLIEKCGATGTIVDNGQAAYQYYVEHAAHIDVIFMDCQMPIMDGYEATRAIRAYEHRHNRPRCPIIGLSAHALSQHREKALDTGMDEYLTKPVHLKDISRVFRDLDKTIMN